MASYDISVPTQVKNGWSGQSILLFIYSAVVTFALILIIYKNLETPAQIIAEERLAATERQENIEQLAVNNLSVPEVYETEHGDEFESFDNPSIQWEVDGEETQPEIKEDTLIVERGDNLIGILQKIGMEYQEANQVVESLKSAGYDVRSLRIGQKLEITKTVDVPFGELLSVDKIVLSP